MVRKVILAKWSQVPSDFGDGLLRFEIRANAFCHQMVRSIVGTMVDAGAGRVHAGDVRGMLLAKDRHVAGKSLRHRVCAFGKSGMPERMGTSVRRRPLTAEPWHREGR